MRDDAWTFCPDISFLWFIVAITFLIGGYVITSFIADHNVFVPSRPHRFKYRLHMKNIYDTLAGIQSRRASVDERLSLIEANIFNIGMTTPQPGPSFSSPDVTLSSLPADCSELNLQVPVENTLPLQSLEWSPDMRNMEITTPKQSSKRSTYHQKWPTGWRKSSELTGKHLLVVVWTSFSAQKKWLTPTWMGRGIKTNLTKSVLT